MVIIAVEFPPCFENFWEQFRKSGARWKMLFKYTLKNNSALRIKSSGRSQL